MGNQEKGETHPNPSSPWTVLQNLSPYRAGLNVFGWIWEKRLLLSQKLWVVGQAAHLPPPHCIAPWIKVEQQVPCPLSWYPGILPPQPLARLLLWVHQPHDHVIGKRRERSAVLGRHGIPGRLFLPSLMLLCLCVMCTHAEKHVHMQHFFTGAVAFG